MADLRTHQCVGMGAGAVYAGYLAKEQTAVNWWIEVLGGGAGGFVGGWLPDHLEPAVSSWHRDICHSWAAGGAVVSFREKLIQLGQTCRENAALCRPVPLAPDPQTGVLVPMWNNPLTRLLSELAELFWRFLAGFVNGLAAGHASHLLLDATTPRGIPLLTRG